MKTNENENKAKILKGFNTKEHIFKGNHTHRDTERVNNEEIRS